jgi:hypothetical protein
MLDGSGQMSEDGLARMALRASGPLGVIQVSGCSCCDYPEPVFGPGSVHIGQGHIVQGTYRLRDASFTGRLVPQKRTGRRYIRLTPINT